MSEEENIFEKFIKMEKIKIKQLEIGIKQTPEGREKKYLINIKKRMEFNVDMSVSIIAFCSNRFFCNTMSFINNN